jgi:hypothetical protein
MARVARFNGDVVSRLEGGNRGPNGVDDAGCFVAHDDRLLGGYEAFASAMEPEMDLVLVVRFGFCNGQGKGGMRRTSLPQTPVYAMRMITSDGSSICGMGLSSNLASNGPYKRHDGFCISDKETVPIL